jgi:hypothetical protein
MGWLDKLLVPSISQPVEAVGNVLDKLFTSDDERLGHEELLTRLAQAPHIAQTEINKIEAQHRSVFVAGWRPAIGWVCAVSLLFPFIINPCIQWWSGTPGPVLPLDSLTQLVYALLGLGALRTVEKVQGRAK